MVVQFSKVSKLSPNRLALPLVYDLMKNQERLKIRVYQSEGVTLIDCGVKVFGSWLAGQLFAEICLGGLAQVSVRTHNYGRLNWPSVEVITDHPLRACLLSQFAGWPIQARGFYGMGSGPSRSRADVEQIYGDFYGDFGSEEDSDYTILCLESEDLPSKDVLREILMQFQDPPSKMFILVAPTASLVGSIQIAARALETGIYKLKELSYDLTLIQNGWGVCPIPPVGGDNLQALGRTNDAIRYGSIVYVNVEDEDERLIEIIDKVPASASSQYEKRFEVIYKEYGDFYEIDPMIFGPAEIRLTNVKSGRTLLAGKIAVDLLQASFGIEQVNGGK